MDALTTNRDLNRLRMLQTLLRHRRLSRAELSRSLGLSRATVATILAELESAGMVEQQADIGLESRRAMIGRPPLHVSLARDAAFAVGLDFGHRHVRAAVCDLGGGVIADRWAEIDVDTRPAASFDLAQRLANEALTDAEVDRSRLIGAGVGLAVPVDAATGTVHTDGILPAWAGVAPIAELEARLHMPVQVENDANAGAIGEHLFGAGRGHNDLIYLRLSAGIGVGLILGGQSYRGVAGVAGEIGHTRAVEHGLICRCGNRGCLETIAGPLAIADLLARSRRAPMSVAGLLDALRAGDRGVQRAIADAGVAVGNALASTINLLNPGLVIIGGELAEAGNVLLDPIRSAIHQSVVPPAAASVRVIAGALGERAEVLGAAAIRLSGAPEALVSQLAQAA
jgi:predicted NBD/HSP70 family sugar kinase